MSSFPRIAAVAFDMDGVIFDTEKLYFAAQDRVLERRRHRFTPKLAGEIMGMPGLAAMAHVRESLDLDDSAETLFEESIDEFQALLPTELKVMEGALELLEAARARHWPTALATSTHRELAMRMLEAFDLPRRFEAILTCDDVVHGKPHPEMYQKAFSALGVSAAETLVIEDSFNGAVSALTAGCFTVAVRHEHNRQVEFPAGIAFVADSMLDKRLHELVARG